MNFSTLTAKLAQSVLHITLDRPAQRNAMSLAMVADLHTALGQALADPAIRILVLRGAGGNFCAGGDIADMAKAGAQPAAGEADPLAAMNEKFGHLCATFAQSSKPVIAILEGAVIGGGFGLACVADIAIAAPDAKFRLSETTLGLIPAQIAPFLVARLGFSTANRLALTAATLNGRQAHQIGLVHEIAEGSMTINEKLQSIIIALKKSSPAALAATKSLLRRAVFEPPETLIADAAHLFARAARGAEAQEGMAAFLQKRAPSWAESR
jgi:isohexenylglutaconyl-CoA hydratase